MAGCNFLLAPGITMHAAAYYAERKQVLAFVWVNPTHFAIFTTHTQEESLGFVVRAASFWG
jgi:hypothetical protein